MTLRTSMSKRRRGLVDRHDKELSNIDMRRPRGTPNDFFGDIMSNQWLNSLVNSIGSVLVAPESDNGELRLHHTRLNLTNSDGGVDKFS